MKAFPSALLASISVVAALGPGEALAAHARSSFNVQVQLGNQVSPGSSFCRISDMPGAFGAIVTVVCSTGVVVQIDAPSAFSSSLPIHGGAYRFLPPVSWAGVMSDDMTAGLGTVTSWRVIKLADRDLLEMTVRW
ncbi:MAG TPA: hypothetical protein VH040_03580 [Usitatibacter sp.]|nr:hypothetical protein [Usitatibacter sp.]